MTSGDLSESSTGGRVAAAPIAQNGSAAAQSRSQKILNPPIFNPLSKITLPTFTVGSFLVLGGLPTRSRSSMPQPQDLPVPSADTKNNANNVTSDTINTTNNTSKTECACGMNPGTADRLMSDLSRLVESQRKEMDMSEARVQTISRIMVESFRKSLQTQITELNKEIIELKLSKLSAPVTTTRAALGTAATAGEKSDEPPPAPPLTSPPTCAPTSSPTRSPTRSPTPSPPRNSQTPAGSHTPSPPQSRTVTPTPPRSPSGTATPLLPSVRNLSERVAALEKERSENIAAWNASVRQPGSSSSILLNHLTSVSRQLAALKIEQERFCKEVNARMGAAESRQKEAMRKSMLAEQAVAKAQAHAGDLHKLLGGIESKQKIVLERWEDQWKVMVRSWIGAKTRSLEKKTEEMVKEKHKVIEERLQQGEAKFEEQSQILAARKDAQNMQADELKRIAQNMHVLMERAVNIRMDRIEKSFQDQIDELKKKVGGGSTRMEKVGGEE
jgi:hypothetical protein